MEVLVDVCRGTLSSINFAAAPRNKHVGGKMMHAFSADKSRGLFEINQDAKHKVHFWVEEEGKKERKGKRNERFRRTVHKKSVCSTDSSTTHANPEAALQVYTLQKIILLRYQHKLDFTQQSYRRKKQKQKQQ